MKNSLTVNVQRVRRPGWYRHVITALIGIVMVLPASALAPERTEAYSWGPWSPYTYIVVTDEECTFARKSMAKFIGPLSPTQLTIGCRQAMRRRTMTLANGQLAVHIQNVGPLGGYGMDLESTVSWDGKTVTATPPVCRHWAVIVKTEPEKCEAIGNGTQKVFLRMDYRASWSFLWVSVNVGRGAMLDVSSTGWIGSVVRWP